MGLFENHQPLKVLFLFKVVTLVVNIYKSEGLRAGKKAQVLDLDT